MNDTRLLPYEVIDAKLLDSLTIQQDKDDKGLPDGQAPEYWKHVSDETRKSKLFDQVISEAYEQVERLGVERALGGIVLKSVLMGWRMADIYLNQQVEKSGDNVA